MSEAIANAEQSRRNDAGVLLVISIGAGRSNNEIIAVRAGDIAVSEEGVVVTARDDRPREVPVLRKWEGL